MLYEKIMVLETFNNIQIGQGVFVVKDTYDLQMTLTCLPTNHVVLLPTDAVDHAPVCGKYFFL